MFTAQIENLNNPKKQKIILKQEGRSLSFEEVIYLWREDKSFCSFFISVLDKTPYEAYFWETPPVNQDTLDRDFEFVWIESSALASVQPEAHTFREHFDSESEIRGVTSFWNLGRDSRLVAPYPKTPVSDYSHLAAFMRNASNEQKQAFWRIVGEEMKDQISNKPLWLSTSGLGVYWLHVRLDSRPKYYQHTPYKMKP